MYRQLFLAFGVVSRLMPAVLGAVGPPIGAPGPASKGVRRCCDHSFEGVC